jgi:hypothetical protein
LGLEEKKRKKKHVILGEALNRRMEWKAQLLYRNLEKSLNEKYERRAHNANVLQKTIETTIFLYKFPRFTDTENELLSALMYDEHVQHAASDHIALLNTHTAVCFQNIFEWVQSNLGQEDWLVWK